MSLSAPRTTADQLLDTLNDDDFKQASRYTNDELRQRFITTRGTLKQLLAQQLNCSPQQLALSRNRYGKPYLTGDPVFFNVSHTNAYAAIALSSHAVGIDIETIRSLDAIALSKRFFHPDEARHIANYNTAKQATEFIRLWTRKEAVLKAHGTGIAHHLDCNALNNPIMLGDQHCYYWQNMALSQANTLCAIASQLALNNVKPTIQQLF